MQDKDLIILAKLGNKAALEKIVEIYYNDIYVFLVRRLSNSFIAEDITQETFLKFTKSLPNYREQNKLKSYLFTLAINCSNDWFRKNGKDNSLSYNESLENIESSDDIEKNFEYSEKAELVKKAISTLNPAQRDIVILRYYHDMKLIEIAKVTKTPLATVKTRLHRANKALREILKGEEL